MESELAIPPRSGHPAKMTPEAQHRILNEVKNDPRGTAKDFKTSLELEEISHT